MNLKLDEIIRALHEARNDMIDLEYTSDEHLDKVEHQFHELSEELQESTPNPEETSSVENSSQKR